MYHWLYHCRFSHRCKYQKTNKIAHKKLYHCLYHDPKKFIHKRKPFIHKSSLAKNPNFFTFDSLNHTNMKNTINDFALNFGKFKGQQFSKTPSWYQEWLVKQDWFKMPQSKPLHKQLVGWDGNSRKGEAIYDAIFEQEKREALKHDCRLGICSCCSDSKYYGM